jgi:hypothetical protein
MGGNGVIRTLMIVVLLSAAPLGLSAGSDKSVAPATRQAPISSADDFDWRDMLPYLYEAASMPPEQGLKDLLENSRVLRAYVAGDIQARCNQREQMCGAKLSSSALQAEITKDIDEIVQESLFTRRKVIRVDYALTQRPFPFTAIVALKTTNHRDAYLVLDFADESYTATEVQKKYGAPYDVTLFEWFTVHKYRLERPTYVAKAAFTVNPIDGYVHRVAVSLKRKDK